MSHHANEYGASRQGVPLRYMRSERNTTINLNRNRQSVTQITVRRLPERQSSIMQV